MSSAKVNYHHSTINNKGEVIKNSTLGKSGLNYYKKLQIMLH